MASKVSRPINRVVSSAAPKKKLDIDSLLTPERKKELREQAEDKVRVREIADAEDQYLQQQMTEYERKLHPEIVQEMRDISLYLPPHMDFIILDGTTYVRGGIYSVRKSVYDVMQDIIFKGFRHDDEIQGRSAEQRKERNLHMSARDGRLLDNTGKQVSKF